MSYWDHLQDVASDTFQHWSDVIANDPAAQAAALAALAIGTGGGSLLAEGAGAAGAGLAEGAGAALGAGAAEGAGAALGAGAAEGAAGGIGALVGTDATVGGTVGELMGEGAAGAGGAAGSGGIGSLTGAGGAGAAGAAGTGASINEMVASGLTPGSAGAAGAASGALTGDALAAASGVGTASSALTAAEIAKGIKDAKSAADLIKMLTVGGAGAAVIKSLTGGGGGNSGYQGVVPTYTASREQKSLAETRPSINGKAYRPGQGGITYFTPVTYTKAAEGGLMSISDGTDNGQPFHLSMDPAPQNNYPATMGSSYPSREGGISQNGVTQPDSLPQSSGLGGLFAAANPQTNFNNGGAVQGQYNLGSYSDGGRLLKGPGDGVSDSIPAIIGQKQPARLATGEFVIPARIVSELGNGSTEAGAQRLYEMMDRIQKTRLKTKNVAANTNAAKYLPA